MQNESPIARIIDTVETAVVGKRNEIILLLTAMLAGTHVLIEDVPGTGKTSLASALARATGLGFRRAQFTPDVMASDITGYNLYNRAAEAFEFREGLVMSNILLADEINRASPKTQSALLEAMEEARVTVDGVTYALPDPFMVIATQNPTGYVGTYPLPEAQLDRFAIKISMGYPTEAEEVSILRARHGSNPLDGIRAAVDADTVRILRRETEEVHVDDAVYGYIVSLVSATRGHSALALGASPRASVALMHLAQAYARIRERDFVLPDDVAALFRPAVAHRLVLRQDARIGGITAESVLDEIMRTLPVPYRGAR